MIESLVWVADDKQHNDILERNKSSCCWSGGWIFIIVYKLNTSSSGNNITGWRNWKKQTKKQQQTITDKDGMHIQYRSILCDVDGVYGYMNI